MVGWCIQWVLVNIIIGFKTRWIGCTSMDVNFEAEDVGGYFKYPQFRNTGIENPSDVEANTYSIIGQLNREDYKSHNGHINLNWNI